MQAKRVLIIEDELPMAMTLCSALLHPMGGGHQVEVCPLADVAIKRLRYEQFDLIVTDLRMPGKSGLELIRHVRQSNSSTRMILITGFGSPEIEKQVLGLGAVYLTKPFSLQEFVAITQRLLSEDTEQDELGKPPSANGGSASVVQ
jgi:DNA-binding response OmpR family regulator